jgi:cyanophycinase-like exopeptidase
MNGAAYLVASGQDGLLGQIARRALDAIGKPQPRVAVSYAPVEGDRKGLTFMSGRMPGLFPGAVLEAIEHDRRVVDRADLLFVSGGDPTLGAKVLSRTGAAGWVREAHARGVPVMGVSAGAILLGEWWIEWPEDPPQGEPTARRAHPNDDEDAPPEAASLVPCTGLVAGHVFDTHDEADGWEELHVAAQLLRARGLKAHLLGIPTAGALVFHPDGRMEVVGIPPTQLG